MRRFVEKPAVPEAAALIADGALWNLFIVAARAQSLLDLLRAKNAFLVERMRTAWRLDAHCFTGYSAIADLYRTLPTLDFSRDVAQGREAALSVLQVPPCGWSDLGTPERVAKALLRLGPVAGGPPARRAPLCLEERLARRDAAAAGHV